MKTPQQLRDEFDKKFNSPLVSKGYVRGERNDMNQPIGSTTSFKINGPMETCQNKRGEWVPAIPEPYQISLGRCRCNCGHVSWTRKRYREHYALRHILAL